jgi:hypothetical protein
MGYLLIDHSQGGIGPHGERGVKFECDTQNCPHCQAVIRRVVLGPCRTVPDSPGECDHCRRPVCRACADRLRASEVCPGEMKQNIDRMWQGMRSADSIFVAMRR